VLSRANPVPVSIVIAQVPVVWDVDANLDTLRDAENQRFLAAANAAHPDQHCPSMLVSPRGEVLGELPMGPSGLLRHDIDLSETGDWYLGQRRQDVLSLTCRPS